MQHVRGASQLRPGQSSVENVRMDVRAEVHLVPRDAVMLTRTNTHMQKCH